MSDKILLTQEQLQKLATGIMKGATVAQATGMKPEALENLYALAHGLYTSGNFKDAQTVFQALSIYNSQDYRFWMGLAGCRQALEQYQAAIDAYQMAAVATLLKNPEPFLFAARCLLKLGRKDDCIVAIKALLKIGNANDPRHAIVHTKARALLALLEQKEN